jgi:hypothetical protein
MVHCTDAISSLPWRLGSIFSWLWMVCTAKNYSIEGISAPPPRTGGRRKGTPNKRTAERQAALRQSGSQAGVRDFFTDLLKNEDAPLELRFSAAKELGPYVYPKLASIEARTGGKTHEQRLAELEAMDNGSEE